jgi:chromosome segregation ATPase
MDSTSETIMETTETTPASVDLVEAQAKLSELQTAVRAQEIVLAAEELHQAETVHAGLFQQCKEQQRACDDLDRRIEQQQHAVLQAETARGAARAQFENRRLNPPARRYDVDTAGWEAGFAGLREAIDQAEASYAAEIGKLLPLQSDRRIALQRFSDIAFQESTAANRLAGARVRLASLEPQERAKVDPRLPQLNRATLTFSTDSSLRSDPVSRRAAARGPADSQ